MELAFEQKTKLLLLVFKADEALVSVCDVLRCGFEEQPLQSYSLAFLSGFCDRPQCGQGLMLLGKV